MNVFVSRFSFFLFFSCRCHLVWYFVNAINNIHTLSVQMRFWGACISFSLSSSNVALHCCFRCVRPEGIQAPVFRDTHHVSLKAARMWAPPLWSAPCFLPRFALEESLTHSLLRTRTYSPSLIFSSSLFQNNFTYVRTPNSSNAEINLFNSSFQTRIQFSADPMSSC